MLRGFAMLIDGDLYAPSMVKFLNQFSRKCRAQGPEQNEYLSQLLISFLGACATLADDAFLNKKNRRFNVGLYEAAFASVCEDALREKAADTGVQLRRSSWPNWRRTNSFRPQ